MEKKSGFDRMQFIGLLLIGAVFFWFSYSNSGESEQPQETPAELVSDSTQVVNQPASTDSNTVAAEVDSVKEVVREEEFYSIENDLIKMEVSNLGAQITKVQLKEYQTWDSTDLYLVSEGNQKLSFELGKWSTKDVFFEVTERTATSLALSANGPNGPFTVRWELTPGEYQTEFSVKGQSQGRNPLVLNWEQNTIKHEKSRTLENQKTQISYWEIEDGEREDLSETSADSESASNIRWVAHQEQFFSTIITAQGRFDSASMASFAFEGGPYIKDLKSRIYIQEVDGNFGVNMNMYLGPNKYDILKKYDLGYDQIIDFGWGIFGWISRGVVVKVFNWLDSYGLNYGLIIFLMAFGIKFILSPLTFTSYRSMAKMRVLKPEIDELNEKFKDEDPMKKQQAMMDLYRKAGVNPLGGCIPQLVQLPILFAMFRFFPASIELRQESFWWATDLSTYDVIARLPFEIPFYGDHVSLFTILMAISTFMYSYMNQQMTGSQNSQMPALKYIVYIMPFMLLFFFNSYPAALSYYYLISNVLTFGQQFAIRRFIDEDALHAKLQENKTKPKKESKFQKRLNKAMEDQKDQPGTNRRVRRMNK
ncbi:MAG: membrane protein insertase YidC [Flavobacteriia bacterium]|nr:membrane protein insertase YidC [Flavobacteriia bacterium]